VGNGISKHLPIKFPEFAGLHIFHSTQFAKELSFLIR